jgi:hypothetical protein
VTIPRFLGCVATRGDREYWTHGESHLYFVTDGTRTYAVMEQNVDDAINIVDYALHRAGL